MDERKKWMFFAVLIGVAGYLFLRPKKAIAAPLDAQGLKLPDDDIRITKHTVARGESYSTIAKKYYGDWSLWPFIYDYNKTKLGSNPDLLSVGAVVVVPPGNYMDPNKFVAYQKRAKLHAATWDAWAKLGKMGVPNYPPDVLATT